MGRWLLGGWVVALVSSCAANSLQVPETALTTEAAPATSIPGAVTLSFVGGTLELEKAAQQLLPRAKERLGSLGHAVVPESDLAVELELRASRGANSVQMCVLVTGRVVRAGQRFTSVELCRVACTTASLGNLAALATNVGLIFVDESERAQGPAADAVDALLTELSRHARVRAPR